MPLKNSTDGKTYPFKIFRADKFLTRLIGLLGTTKPDPSRGLYIIPCSGIHTFGMKYPIDILFLDKNGCVIKATPNLQANKVTKIIHSVKSILELPPGAIIEHNIKVGDHLQVVADEKYRTDVDALKNIFHWPINVFIALLWSKFVFIAINDWLKNSGPINLGILVHNTLLLFLFLTRRKSIDMSHRMLDWIIPGITLASAMMLRPSLSVESYFNILSGSIQCIGILGIIVSLLSLGRSFGIIPANRKIKYSGAYKIVRHPLYSSELIFYSGFFLGNLSIRNFIFIIVILAGQLLRSLSEEKLLSQDLQYRAYLKNIRYRFIPGLF